jgi:glycosyltransferase involved in cell wall biosynthesis
MAPFTGGCHYAWECKGYQNSCGSCPGLFSSDPSDISNKNLNFKKGYLDRINLEVIAGSEWQLLQARASTLFKNKRIHKMLIPIDPIVFKPVDKQKIRHRLNIPADRKILFFGAVGLAERRKGMHFLIESLHRLKELMKSSDHELADKILLLIAGQEFDAMTESLPFEYTYMGYLNSGSQLAEAYQAADVFICPSIEDSGPMMVNQSIMSGTPVVSFNMGVSVDLVRTGETGYLAQLKDSNDMAMGLFRILKLAPDDYNRMSFKCREVAMRLFSPEVRIELLESIMKNQCQKG